MAVSKRLRFEILRRDKHACKYCGRTAPQVVLTVDHVVPVTLGGGDEPANLVAACGDCNGGKTSVPADAPLVADVAADALRWAKAMAIVAQDRAAGRAKRQERYDQFESHWNTWTFRGKWLSSGDYEKLTVPLPGGWRNSVDQFLDAGLEMGDLVELVDVAMGSNSKDEWKYFCGCCWRLVRQSQERAAAITSADEASSETTISTQWTTTEIDDYIYDATDGLECEEHTGECSTDLLCQIVAAARTHQMNFMHSVRDWKALNREASIVRAAEEAEEYIYG